MTGPLAGPDGSLSLTVDQVRTLGEGGVFVLDGALGPALAARCAAAAMALDDQGALDPARIGRDKRHRPSIRGDRLAWLSEQDLSGPLGALWSGFCSLQVTLNRDVWLGLQRFAVQVACYPGEGERYAAHLDALRGDPARRVTAIVYLNPRWEPAHGGVLVADTPGGPVRVEPRLDRLVLFLSDRVRHEVEPAWAPRFAATAWYRGPEPLPLLADPA